MMLEIGWCGSQRKLDALYRKEASVASFGLFSFIVAFWGSGFIVGAWFALKVMQ